MDISCPNLHLVTCTMMSVLCAFAHVTVRSSDLKLCKPDNKMCVTKLEDCDPRPPSAVQKMLNMSCHYQISLKSVTCAWSGESNSHTESVISLIFSRNDIIFCGGIFNPSVVLNITAKIRNYMVGNEIWSQPHTVHLYDAVKPSRPVLTLNGFTEDSVVVSWNISSDGTCRLRYRLNSTQTWSQAPDSVAVHADQMLRYTFKNLLPFSIYRVAVACREESGFWSDWSSDVTARTLDRVPSEAPKVCYRVEKTDSGGPVLLHLMWKAPDLHGTGGRILGYQVSYKPVKNQQPQDTSIQNITEVMAPLVVEEGNWSVTVTGFNTAGYGPPAHLNVDTQRHSPLPSVRNLWVSSSFPSISGLQVQWESSAAPPPAPPISHFDVQWRSEMDPSNSRWATVDSLSASTVIPDVDPDESYLISVFPVYEQQCGPPQSLPAGLQQGALMEVVNLKVVGVTKTTVTVEWAWQRKSGPIRVNRYSMMLRTDSERRTLPLWPDQQRHTFPDLKPSTEYSLVLLADNISRSITSVRTDFDEFLAVATATPLLLLSVTVLIISILSRTVYKWYFFPPISSPKGSTTGQWLMDPNHQKSAERNILEIKDFLETDILGEKSAIVVRPSSGLPSEESLNEDTSLLPLAHLIIRLSSVKLDTEYVSDTLQVQLSHPDRAVQPEESLLHRQAHGASSWFPRQEEEENGQLGLSQTSYQEQINAVKCDFHQFVANADAHCAYQMSCEAEYVANASCVVKTDVETVSAQTGCSYLICETEYLANSCFTAESASSAGDAC
uniref:interleukin-6 receptor subunit beta isoform X2 n=1 Tax=Monopterus albus TaxID=43700 RepID=UPI0009B30244|nr:interleukin-6 receptor subunit beta-like isoform X2 [Monopterus albus]